MIKLYNDDCMNIFKTIKDESVDLFIADVPYRVTARGGYTSAGGMLKKDIVRKGKVFNNIISCREYFPEIYRVLKNGSHCYIMTNHTNLIEILNIAIECGFHFIKSLIWDKQNKIMGTFYMSQFEYILLFRKGKAIPINNCGTSDIISVPNKKTKGADGKNLHDTEKPVELMKILVENSSKEGDLVMDSFMGIGATGVACKETNRDFIGCEIDKKYFDIAEERINQSDIKVQMTDIFGV